MTGIQLKNYRLTIHPTDLNIIQKCNYLGYTDNQCGYIKYKKGTALFLWDRGGYHILYENKI